MEFLSYFINILTGIFILFRAYVGFMHTTGSSTGFMVIDPNIELMMLFVSVISLVMIFKRNILFAAIMLAMYFAYFGYGISLLLGTSSSMQMLDMFGMFIGILLALLNFIDVVFNKNRKGSTKNTKTDWFYATDKYEREFDERADRNQYKF